MAKMMSGFESISEKIIFFSYILFFSTLFFLDNFDLTNKLFIYLIIPLAIIDSVVFSIDKKHSKIALHKVSNQYLKKTKLILSSKILIATFLYLISITLSSTFIPEPSLMWFRIIGLYSALPILIFMIITMHLFVRMKDFIFKLYFFLVPISALNAAMNIYFYFHSLPTFDSFKINRMEPVFGLGIGYGATTSALTYSLFFIAGLNLLSRLRSLKYLMIALSLLILLIAVLLTTSRGSLISLALTTICYVSFNKGSSKRILVGSSFVLFSFLMVPQLRSQIINRGGTYRTEIWYKFISLASERFLFGYGESLKFSVAFGVGEKAVHGHNMLLNSLLHGGVIGLASMTYIFVFGLYNNFRFYRLENNGIPFFLLLTIFFSGLIDYDLLVFPASWEWPTFWLPIALTAGGELFTKYQASSIFKHE